jgi:hypothetical protein
MGDIVNLPCATVLDIPPEKVLAGALAATLTEVVLFGYDSEGEPYFATSLGDNAKVAYLLTRALHKLNTMADDAEG